MPTHSPELLIKNISGYAKLGYATFATHNKKPIKAGVDWKKSPVDIFCLPENYPHNQYGIVLKEEDLIVDIDPRNMGQRKVWSEFKERYSIPNTIEDTMSVVTGAGGFHIYLRKPPLISIRARFKEFPGIDFKTLGGYVIGPGSVHESGNPYTFLQKPFDISDAPIQLLQALQKTEEIMQLEGEQGFNDSESNIKRYVDFLRFNALPAREGAGGDCQTYKTACRGRDYNLTPQMTLQLMLEYYNSKCEPPWDHMDLKNKVFNAYQYNSSPAGKQDPGVVFNSTKYTEKKVEIIPGEKFVWDTTQKGAFRPTMRNCSQALALDGGLKGALAMNEFTNDIEIIQKVPWENERESGNRMFSDSDCAHLKYYLACKYDCEFKTSTIWEAIMVAASRYSFHPVKQYLTSITWDGTSRLDTWLSTYCGAIDTEYSRTIGSKTLVAAVARVFNPGVKFDHVLILEGEQRIGKSYTCSILGRQWFGDFNMDVRSKDIVEQMRGCWIVELSEMEMARKTDVQALKAFITRTTDRIRPAYKRVAMDFPRQCIFIGTVNPDGSGYLKDDTGNSRFWPVQCGTFDINSLKRDLNQLWAESVVRYQGGEAVFLESESSKTTANLEADARQIKHPWFDVIERWMHVNETIGELTTQEVYQNILCGSITTMNTAKQRDIARILKMLGWEQVRANRDGKRYTCFQRGVLNTEGVM